MPQHIKAIETNYAGCRFRSRLEARWAVFFDTLGIRWEYEPEGFETSAGRYLPDFRIHVPQVKDYDATHYHQWFEVKPPHAPEDPRHEAFVQDSDAPLIVARDLPRDYVDQLREWPLTIHWARRNREPVGRAGAAFAQLEPWHRPEWSFYCALGDQRHWCQEHFRDSIETAPHLAVQCVYDTGPESREYPVHCPAVDAAYTAARSARFEFGEVGR